MKRRTRILLMIAASVVVTASMVLAKCGLLPVYIFYILLALLHAVIFWRIGTRIYNLKNKAK